MYQVNFNINVSFKGFIRFRKWLTQFHINFYLSFHLTYSLFLFLFLNFFSYTKFLLICFFQLFLIKWSNNFFTIEIINNICPWNITFNFTDYRNFFREQFRVYVLGKTCLYFDILSWSPTWNLGSLLLNSLLQSIYV